MSRHMQRIEYYSAGTVRWSSLVIQLGKPRRAACFTTAEFKALNDDQVVSILRPTGSRKVIGRVGIWKDGIQDRVVFPKPVPGDYCITDVNWEDIESEDTTAKKASEKVYDAAAAGETDKIREALASGADANGMPNDNRPPPLLLAAENGRLETAALLLERGADTSRTDSHWRSAWVLAMMNGHSELADLLERKRGQADVGTALFWASSRGSLGAVQKLLECGADPDTKVYYHGEDSSLFVCQFTPLVVSAELGHGDMVRVLLSHGAGVDAVDDFGRTPWIAALVAGQGETSRILEEYGAQADREAALTYAAMAGEVGLVRTLLEHGVSPRSSALVRGRGLGAEYHPFRLPALHAVLYRYPRLAVKPDEEEVKERQAEIAALLIGRGADVNEEDGRSGKAVVKAAEDARGEVVQLLLSGGRISGDDRQQALLAVCQRAVRGAGWRYTPTVACLIGHGAELNARIVLPSRARTLAKAGAATVVEMLFDREVFTRLSGALETAPATAQDYERRGDVYLLMEQYDRAARDYRKAGLLDPARKESMAGAVRQAQALAAIRRLKARGTITLKESGRLVVRADFYGSKVNDASLKCLKGLVGLRELGLSKTRLGNAALRHLRGLTGLQRLELDLTQVTDAGMKHLAGMTGLQELALRSTAMGDQGVEALAGLPNLRTLDIGNTRVTDAGLRCLRGMAELREVLLFSTRITDAGVQQLAEFPRLEKVDVSFTDVTHAALRALRRAKPGVIIIR